MCMGKRAQEIGIIVEGRGRRLIDNSFLNSLGDSKSPHKEIA